MNVIFFLFHSVWLLVCTRSSWNWFASENDWNGYPIKPPPPPPPPKRQLKLSVHRTRANKRKGRKRFHFDKLSMLICIIQHPLKRLLVYILFQSRTHKLCVLPDVFIFFLFFPPPSCVNYFAAENTFHIFLFFTFLSVECVLYMGIPFRNG